MSDKERMTDNEIIKALEHCAGDGYSCTGCAYDKLDYSGDYHCCDYYLKQAALSIIKRQQAEIERLKSNVFGMEFETAMYKAISESAIAEAIKEFAEKMKEIIPEIDDTYIEPMVEEHIDKIVKEMVGAENET